MLTTSGGCSLLLKWHQVQQKRKTTPCGASSIFHQTKNCIPHKNIWPLWKRETVLHQQRWSAAEGDVAHSLSNNKRINPAVTETGFSSAGPQQRLLLTLCLISLWTRPWRVSRRASYYNQNHENCPKICFNRFFTNMMKTCTSWNER